MYKDPNAVRQFNVVSQFNPVSRSCVRSLARILSGYSRSTIRSVSHQAWIPAVNLFKTGGRETLSRPPEDLI